MKNFKEINLISKNHKDELNLVYKNMYFENLDEALKICQLANTKSAKLAIIKRVIDLKEDGIQTELKKIGKSADEIEILKAKMYDFVSDFHIKRHEELIDKLSDFLDEFHLELIRGIHKIGIELTKMQKKWQKHIINEVNKEFGTKFKTLNEANEFISKNSLFQVNLDGSRCQRTYGAVVKEDGKYKFLPYALVFKDEIKNVSSAFDNTILKLKNLCQTREQEDYLNYLKKLQIAFLESDNSKVVARWQDAERAWMEVKDPFQVGHPLEYYEDEYTHAVALEWDIRLKDDFSIDEKLFKENIWDSFTQIYKQTSIKNEKMKNLVHSNIEKTQLYICNPLIFYGAEFDGLFSAQVVPNDEIVSSECGKKIFAFVNFVYESVKSKPFMKLSSEIFSKEFLDFGREILFKKPDIWKKVYEISTIGHEFGHILFIDSDTENIMNKGGEFKFIEEYKATTGGLVNFFLHEDNNLKMAIFNELIKRSVGLISWQNTLQTRAYYCEGLIHLSLLFSAKVLDFKEEKLYIDFTQSGYKKFKNIVLQNYILLAKFYCQKLEAGEFLNKFASFNGQTYLPKDKKCKEFVEYYYSRYEKIANEIDESKEWEKWKNL